MPALSSDKVLFGAAVLLALGSAAGFGMLAIRRDASPNAPVPQVQLTEAPYAPTAPEAPPIKTEQWPAPPAQTRGRDWVYDAFTPPEIYYNPRSKGFTVRPPSSLLDEETTEAFGIELVAVRPEPFRLQLIGYVGQPGSWRGVFQNAMSGEVFLASAGHRLPNLALSIKRLDVDPQPIALPESMTTRQRVATAVIRDEKANRDITLTHRERTYTGTVFAFVAETGQTAAREVRTGDSFKIGEATFRVDRIETTPPTIEITKESPSLLQPDRRVLTPRETEGPDETEPTATTP
ncbi:MAG: hypothetical protein HZC55_27890 [Verrucomicrobia bacterium]|nr:hypothetical protein [Verrucomicrobiota bacterium]